MDSPKINGTVQRPDCLTIPTAVTGVEPAVKYSFVWKGIQTRRKGQCKVELTLSPRLHVKPLIMAFSLKYLTTHFKMPEIFIDITPDIQLNRIFINIKLKLMQGSNQFLTWQLISGKTFHLFLKDLSVFEFPKYIKRYLLSEQKRNQFST